MYHKMNTHENAAPTASKVQNSGPTEVESK